MPYLNRITNLKFGGATFTGTTDELNTVAGVVPGIVNPNGALVVNSLNDLSGVNTLTANSYNGTLLTASQPNITTVGTLNGLSVTGTTTTDILSATTISGSLITASQPNITTIGTLSNLNLTGSLRSSYTANGTDTYPVGQMAYFKSDFLGGSAFLELNNQAGTRFLFGCDGSGLLGDSSHVALGNYSNGDIKLFTNATEKVRIKASGGIGIGTTLPNKQLSINHLSGDCIRLIYNNALGTETIYTDLSTNSSGEYIITPTGTLSYIKSNLVIGKSLSGPNVLYFNGTTDDTGINVSAIAERIYGGTQKSELLIYKGSDINTTDGPDRIRLRAAEHRFQTYTAIEDFSTSSDNNTRLIIINSGFIGIGTTIPSKQLTINNITGDCLRLIYNNSSGTETIFSDFQIDSSGNLNITTTGNFIFTTKRYRIQTSGGDGFSHLSPNGLVELITRSTNSLTQIGNNTNNTLHLITNNTNRLTILSSGNVGVGTTVPNKTFTINNLTGNCLRLIYNNSSGSETIYTDLNIDTSGNLNILPTGTYIQTTNKQFKITNSGIGYSHLSGTGVELSTIASGNTFASIQTISSHPLYLGTNNISRLAIDTSGQVGIGTLTPAYAVQLNTAINKYGFVHTTGSITLASYLGGTTADAQIGTLSAHSLSFFANTGSVRMILSTSGNFGVNTITPNKKISVNSSTGDCLRLIYNNSTGIETNYVDFNVSSTGELNITPTATYSFIKSNLVVGRNTTGPNMLQFNGTTSDDSFTTVLMERIYSNPQSSELLIFKGDDLDNINGPDRIRMRSSEFRFQTFTTSGEKAASQSIGTILDNNNRLVILNSGKIGVGTTLPNKQFTVNSSTGECIRMVYNSSTGGETSYSDISISNAGVTTFNTVGFSTGFVFSGGEIFGTLANGPQPNITQVGTLTNLTITGALVTGSFSTSSLGGTLSTPAQPNITSVGQYLLIGTSTDSTRMISALKGSIVNNTSISMTLGKSNSILNQAVITYSHVNDGSTSNNIGLGFTNQRILNIYGNNKVGINTTAPARQFTVNSQIGECIRIIYNNSVGTESTYADYLISNIGGVTFNAVGTNPSFTFLGGNVNATLASGPQPNITSVGTLSNLTVTNTITAATVNATSVGGTLTTAAQPNITSLGTLTNLVVSGTLVVGTFSAGAVASVIQTPNQPNITSLGTLTSLNMSGPITGATSVTAGSFIGTINTSSQPNITSLGTLTNLLMSGPISGVTTLSATSLSGTLTTVAQPNITSVGTLTSLKTGTGKVSINTTSAVKQVNINSSTGEILRFIYNNNNNTESTYIDLDLNSSGRLTFTANGSNPRFSFIGGDVAATISTSAQPNITSLGTLSSLNVSGTLTAGGLSVTSLGGTLTTAAQPNITSLGTLNSLTMAGAISGVTTLTASNLVGTILTGTQPNITSIGTLTTLRTGANAVSINTTSTSRQVNINSSFGGCLRLIYNNSTGTETTYSDISVSSLGNLTFTAVGATPLFTFSGGPVAATISTAAQPNITSLGTLTSLTMSGPISGATNITATNLTGTIQTAAQPNITSIGTLSGINLTGQISSTYSTPSALLAFLKNTDTGKGGFLELQNAIGTKARFGADGSALAGGLTSSVVLGNFTNGSLKIFTNSIEQMRFTSTGLIGINTTVPNKRLSINAGGGTGDCLRLIYNNNLGTESNYADFTMDNTGNLFITPSGSYNYLKSHIVVGRNSSGPNIIHFSGMAGDSGINNTVIAERIYAVTEKSELLLFKGNDAVTGGPDRIRYRSTEHRFQTFTTTEEYTDLVDNNDRLIILNSGLIGINTNVPTRRLTINSGSGSCLRIVYNNSVGTETTYCDETISSTGVVTFNAVGSSPGFVFNGGNITGTLQTAAQPNITSVGQLTTLTVTGNLTVGSFSTPNLGGTLTTAAQPNITSVGTLTSLNVAGALTAGSFSVSELTATIKTASQPFITSLGTLSSLNVSGHLTAGSFNVSNLSTTNISGTLTTAAQPNITSVGTLTGLYVAGTLSADFFDIGDVSATLETPEQPNITSLGTQTVLNISGITTSTNTTVATDNVTGAVKLAGGIAISNTTDAVSSINGGTFTSAGGGAFAKSLYVGTTLTAANLAGTLNTAAQPNITSVGTLTGLTLSGAISGVTTLTATTVTATNVAGTITTAAQPNITSVGTLTSLKIGSGAVGINTSAPDRQLEINNNVGNCLRLTYNDATGGAFNYVDFSVTSNGQLTITPSGTRINIAANKSIVLSGTGSISGVNLLTATNVDSTLITAAQPNITSVGTLTSLTTSGIINSTLSTASTNSTTGALTLVGGIAISNTTNATSNTNGGTFTTAGGGAFAKSLYVGENLTVSGDLTINGITTTVNSTVVEITDNAILLNNGPSGTNYDSGFLVKRYQDSNDSGTGDIVNGISEATLSINSATINTLTFTGTANGTNDYYNNWWVKITSGPGINQVRQIIDYVGTTKTATLDSDLTTTPSGGTLCNVYDRVYTNFIWQESNKRFLTAYTTSSTNSTTLNITKNADLAFEKGYALSTESSTSNLTGSIISSGGIGITNTTDAISATNGGTFTTAGGGAFAKSLFVGTTLTATNLAGTLTTAAQPNITSVGTLSSLTLSGTISGVTTLTATNLAGTLTTAAQPNITSVGTLSSLTLSGTISGVTTLTATNLAGTLITAAQPNITSVGTLSSLTLSGTISGVTTLTATNLAGTLTTAAQPNITSIGTLTTLKTSGSVGINTSAPDKQLEINSATGDCLRLTYNDADGGALNYVDFIVASNGNLTITPSGFLTTFDKQFVIDHNSAEAFLVRRNDDTGDVFLVDTGSELVNIVSHNGTTKGLQLGGTLVTANATELNILDGITSSTTELNILTGVTSTTAELNILDGVTATTTEINKLDGVTATTTELNYVDVTPGTATASKALVLDASSNIATINSLTATSITGTLQTAAQSNITSLGILTNLTVSGSSTYGNQSGSRFRFLESGGVNYIQSGTGTTDSASDLFIGNYSVSTSLSSRKFMIKADGKIGIGTNAPDKELEINSATGDCLRLTYNDNNGSATVYSDFAISSGGILTITPTGASVTLAANKNLVLSGTGSITGVSSLTATNITGTITTATQSNITSIGTLTSLKTTGTVGINTTAPDKQLEVNSTTGNCLRLTYNDANGSAINYTDFLISSGGDLTITPSGGDTTINSSITMVKSGIGFKHQSGLGTEFFTSCSGNTDVYAGSFSNHPFHLSSNNLIRMTLRTDGKIGVGTTIPNKKFTINDSTGGSLRLVYNNTSGSETIYADYSIASTGLITFDANGGASPGFEFTGGNVAATLSTAAQPNITSLGTLTSLSLSGAISGVTTLTATNLAGTLTTAAQPNITSVGTLSGLTVNSSGPSYIYIQQTNTASSFSSLRLQTANNDWQIGAYNANNSSSPNSFFIFDDTSGLPRMIIDSAGQVGIGTSSPDKQLEINATAGDCLRLTYNDANGSATNYTDISLDSDGRLIIVSSKGKVGIHSDNRGTYSVDKEPTLQIMQYDDYNGIGDTALGNFTALRIGTNSSNKNDNTVTSYTIDYDYNQDRFTDGKLIFKSMEAGASAPDDLSFQTAKSANWVVKDIMTFWNNLVGIGTTSPGAKLHILNESTNAINTVLSLDSNDNTDASGLSIDFINSTTVSTGRINNYRYGSGDYGLVFSNYSTSLTDHMVLRNGRMGIGTNNPGKTLEINDATGQCLRLTYNDSDGGAANYSDFTLSSSGDLTISPSGSNTTILGSLAATISTASQPNITSLGTLSSLDISGTGASGSLLSMTATSSAGRALMSLINDSKSYSILLRGSTYPTNPNGFEIYDTTYRFVIASDGNVGIGKIGPQKKLDINDASGQCLRLTYNDSSGPATNYTDFTVSSVGDLTITPSGNDTIITGNLSVDSLTTPTLNLTGLSTNFADGGLVINSFDDIDMNGRLIKQELITDIDLTDYNPTGQTDNYSLEIIGYIQPQYTETYTFYITANDGARLWVNDQLLFNDWIGNSTDAASTTIALTAGKWYPIRIHNNETTLTQRLLVQWESTSQTKANIPSTRMAWDNTNNQTHINPSFIADSMTLYNSSTDTANTCIFEVTSTGELSIVPSGINVGIGTTNPNVNLDIQETGSNAELRLLRTDTNGIELQLKSQDNKARITYDGANGYLTIDKDQSGNSAMYFSGTGLIGINTVAPTKQLEINHATGECLRLIYNDNNGSPANYADIGLNSGGGLLFIPSGGITYNTGLFNTASSHVNGFVVDKTGGIDVFRVDTLNRDIYNFGDVYYANTSGTNIGIIGEVTTKAIELPFINFSMATNRELLIGVPNASTNQAYMRFHHENNIDNTSYIQMFTSATNNVEATERLRLTPSGLLGIGTTAPDKQVEINSATGNCLRLTYNDGDGSAVNYGDLTVTSAGNLVLNASSDYIDITSRLHINISGSNIAFQVNGGAVQNTVINASTTANAVGINTVSTDKALEINDSTGDCLRLTYNDDNGSAANYTDFSVNSSGNLTITPSGGNIGIGTTSPGNNLHIKNSSFHQLKVESDSTTGGATIQFVAPGKTFQMGVKGSASSPNNAFYWYDTTYRMVINTSGDIGINTTSPTARLHIKEESAGSNLRLECTTALLGAYMDIYNDEGTRLIMGAGGSGTGTATTDILFGSWTNSGIDIRTNALTKMYITSGGLVGIGSTAPDKQLEINSASGSCLRLTYNDGNGSAANYTDFAVSSSGDLTITPSGGDTTITGNVSCTLLEETSDIRVKENIIPVDNQDSYNKIKQLEIVDYNFISDEQKIKHRGVIAQDLLNVIPTAVHIKSSEGIEDLHTVSNKEMMGHLLSAFQHLTQKVEKLEEDNKILKEKVEELEKKNN